VLVADADTCGNFGWPSVGLAPLAGKDGSTRGGASDGASEQLASPLVGETE
jgi:hypothetical protein